MRAVSASRNVAKLKPASDDFGHPCEAHRHDDFGCLARLQHCGGRRGLSAMQVRGYLSDPRRSRHTGSRAPPIILESLSSVPGKRAYLAGPFFRKPKAGLSEYKR